MKTLLQISYEIPGWLVQLEMMNTRTRFIPLLLFPQFLLNRKCNTSLRESLNEQKVLQVQGLSSLQKTKQSFDWQLDLVCTSVRPLSDRCTGPEDQSVAIKLGQPLEINYFFNQKWSRTQITWHIILCSDWYVSALIYDFCYPSVLVNNFF